MSLRNRRRDGKNKKKDSESKKNTVIFVYISKSFFVLVLNEMGKEESFRIKMQ